MKLCTFRPAGDAAAPPRLGAASTAREGWIVDLAAAFARLEPTGRAALTASMRSNPAALEAGEATAPTSPRPMQAPLEAGEATAPTSPRSVQGPPHPDGAAVPAWLRSMQELLDDGPSALNAVAALLHQAEALEGGHHLPLDQVTLLAPLPRPRSIRDCMAFEQHFLQARRGGAALKFPAVARLDGLLRRALGIPLIRVPALYREIPAYYKGNPASVVGPDADVQWPSYTERLDYELEIGLFIHRPGRDLDPDRALEHVGGYTIFNDFSARDIQIREMDLTLGPAKGKDFDTGNAMGPWLVTPDEVGDPTTLTATGRVNGEVWTQSATRDLRFSPGEILAYISRSETLLPGDFIGLGTVPNGCGLELGRWLRPGDVVELEVSRLGTLRNRVVRR
jgi:2-keto-4-pentenoate hydratase/2-oxohepta-3-ene-1,7-dioic acid hydratase in catechol pathway